MAHLTCCPRRLPCVLLAHIAPFRTNFILADTLFLSPFAIFHWVLVKTSLQNHTNTYFNHIYIFLGFRNPIEFYFY